LSRKIESRDVSFKIPVNEPVNDQHAHLYLFTTAVIK
jgi:hypothetical protein